MIDDDSKEHRMVHETKPATTKRDRWDDEAEEWAWTKSQRREVAGALRAAYREGARDMRALRADNKRLRDALGWVETWTHVYGAALKPQGADTYGEGVRAAKDQVSALLARAALLPGDEGEGE